MPFEGPDRRSDFVPGRKAALASVRPFETAICFRTFGVAPGKLSTKKKIIIKVPQDITQ